MISLKISKKEEISQYLHSKNWLNCQDQKLVITKPGEGNMNYVIRVQCLGNSIILKQSSSCVEKYPQIPAPAHRVLVEGAFYELVKNKVDINIYMPQMVGLDQEHYIMAIEDLGETMDYSSLYSEKSLLKEGTLTLLVSYLSNLHHGFMSSKPDPIFENLEMRSLNHQHIFRYPFMIDNGFDLNSVTPGLQQVALQYKNNETLKSKIDVLGKHYLENGKYLLHGDYYPGSWVKSKKGLKIIDPEFCFYGSREFDLGVLQAHLIITGNEGKFKSIVGRTYQHFAQLDKSLIEAYAGIEIMRRLIGLAQLPLNRSLENKVSLLSQAYHLIQP